VKCSANLIRRAVFCTFTFAYGRQHRAQESPLISAAILPRHVPPNTFSTYKHHPSSTKHHHHLCSKTCFTQQPNHPTQHIHNHVFRACVSHLPSIPLTTPSRKNTPPPAPPSSSCHRSAATITTKLSIHHMAPAIQEKAIWDTGHERERLTVTSSLSPRGQLRAMG
jgi:hypothetical protein